MGRAFERIAIVNRGEPAMRLILAVREYNREHGTALRTLALFTEADRRARFVREADEAHALGRVPLFDAGVGEPQRQQRSEALARALTAARAEAAWLGWGTAADVADLADLCERIGIPLLGPDAATIRQLQDRAGARRLAEAAGVPVTPVPDAGRRLEVEVVGDGERCWAPAVRACTLERAGQKVLEEVPAGLPPGQEEAVRDAAARFGLAVGFRGVGTVVFRYDPERQALAFVEASPRLQGGHPLTELVTGLDLVKLQLHLARGGRLEGEPPAPIGHALQVRLRAEDPEAGFAPAPGTVELLRLPTGPGLRVDAGLEEGDAVQGADHLTLAKIAAHGRSRAEALARLQRAVAETATVLRGGASNEGFLLGLLEHPDVRAARTDAGWLDRLIAAGEHVARRHGEVAVLAAALAAYEDQVAAEKARFFATAGRGRPEVQETVGRAVELGYDGRTYALAVSRLGRDRYHLLVEGRRVEVLVEERAAHERRLRVAGEAYRVLSVRQNGTQLVRVEGAAHRVAHNRAGAVRAPAPAVVVSVDVAAGDEVRVGDRLAVLEAMKMELAVRADVAGTVRDVAVRPNNQVSAGTPLLFVEPAEGGRAPGHNGRLSFERFGPAAPEADLAAVCRRNLDEVRGLLLGYDVDPAEVQRLLAERGAFCEGLPPDDPAMLRGEDEALRIFADVHGLFRRQRADDDELDDDARRSTEEYLYTYLRDLDAAGADLPPRFLGKLRRALAHYGVRGLARTPELEESLFRLAKAHRRADQQVVPVFGILERRREHRRALAAYADEEFRQLLGRIIAVTQGRFPTLNDLAREVRYDYFERPLLEQARREAFAEAEAHLAALAADPGAADRADRVEALVLNPQPIKTLVAGRLEGAGPAVRAALLEVMLRRYYRIRPLERVRTFEAAGRSFVVAEYDHGGSRVHVVSTHAAYGEVADAVAALDDVVCAVPDGQDVVVDLYAWASEPLGDGEAAAEHLRAVLDGASCPRQLRRVVVAVAGPGGGGLQHFTFRPSERGYWEERFYKGVLHRGLHPMMAKRLHLYRLDHFDVERLPSPEDVHLLRAVAKDNPKDERLFGVAEVRDLTAVRDEQGRLLQLPHFERMLMEVLAGLRHVQAARPLRQRLYWNRVLLYVWPPLLLRRSEVAALARRLAPATEGLGLEATVLHARMPDPDTGALTDTIITVENVADAGLTIRYAAPTPEPLRPLSAYEQKVLPLKQRGLLYPYEIVRMLTPEGEDGPDGLPPGSFQEYDLDEDGELAPVDRPYGQNTANVVVGTIRNVTPKHPEGMERVILLGDPTRGMGNLAEPECRRINAALALARAKGVPLEWFALSAGAKIAMDSGTENMDWIALTLRRIVEFTQAGGEINIVSVGINVGAQPYWNAEATMLMHTRGVLIMTDDAAMVLTGKQALDYSGGVSAEDNFGIGGYERIMGPNGQAQYGARDVAEACRILLRYYDHTYVAAGERFPRRAATADPADRDVRPFPHGAVGDAAFATVGDVFSGAHNPARKRPFVVRKVMRAVTDQDHEPLERWFAMQDAEVAVVWDAHVGGYPVCLIGLESRLLPRLGYVPADGPEAWTGGTLFPRSSKKVARALNAASGNRPVVVLANLSGFDGSPDSMRSWQLEFGAEIGRAVVNFRGPIVFVVISRYHGGAFVVFSNALNENLEVAAIAGSYASVIGGAPAAAVVFAREVKARAQADPRLKALEAEVAAADGLERVRLRARLADLFEEVHAEKLGEVAVEYDGVHDVHRAQRVGSVHRIIAPEALRPYVIDAVERGMRRALGERAAAQTNGAS